MAAQDNFINAKNSVEQLNEAFDRHKKAVSGAVDEMNKLVGEYQKLPSSFKKLIEQAEQNNININKTKNALSEQEKLMRQVAAERERLALATSKENQELQKLRAEKAKINAEYRKESKAQQEQNALSQQAGNYYEQLRIRIARLTQEYQNLAAKKAITGSLTEKEEKRMANLSARLDNYGKTVQKINGATGKAASGFDGLRWQTQQLVREIPAAAYGINVFFGAISNNLPMFIEEVEKAKLENEALIKSGKEAPSVMKRVAGAFFDWRTAIVLVITALTLYSKEIIKAIKGANSFESAIDRSDRANRQFAEGLAQTQAQHQAEIVILNTLVKIIQDETQGREKRSQAVQVLQDKYPDYLKNLNEENITSKEISASIDQISDSLFRKAQVQAASDLVTEKYGEYLEKYVKAQIDAENAAKTMFRDEQDRYSVRMDMLRREEQQWKLLASSQDASDYVKETSERLTNELLKMQQMTKQQALEYMKQGFIAEFARSESEDALQIYNDFNRILEDILKDAPNLFDIFGYPKSSGHGSSKQAEKDINSLYDLIHFRISARIEDEKKLADDEKSSYESRLTHLRAWVNHSMMLLQIETDEKRRIAEKAIKDGSADENELTLITESALRERLNLQRQYSERLSEIQNQEFKKIMNNYQLMVKEQQLELNQNQNILTENLIESEKKARFIQKKLSEQQKIILKEQLEERIKYWHRYIDEVVETCEQEMDILNEISNLVKQLNDIELSIASDKEKQWIDKVSDVFSTLGGLGQIQGRTLRDFFLMMHDGLDESMDKWQQMGAIAQTTGEIMVGIIQTIAKHENERFRQQMYNLELQKDIEITFAGESEEAKTLIEERFDKKKNKLRAEQAKKEKAYAIMEASINTASAIVKALPYIPLVAAVSAIGAAQIAMIAATPIPEFEKGVKDFEGGLAKINEKRDEVVTTPDGKIIKPKGRNLFVNLPKGSNVYASEREFYREINGILGENNIMPIITKVDNYGITKEQMEDIMSRTLAKQNLQNITLDKNGFATHLINKHSKINILNNRVTFKGKNV